jgi:LPS O-antigen subunit length determinant protein (WzzB/FepE family)
MNNTHIIQEDEIDLRELFKTLMKHKIKIVLITLSITLGAIIYALSVPKVYEARAILRIGEYKIANSNDKVVVSDAHVLSKELEILYIDILKNVKDKDAKTEKIEVPKNQKYFLEIITNGSSNKTAKAELQKVVDYVQEKHKKILDDVKNLNEVRAKQVDGKLILLKTKIFPALKEKIDRYKKDITVYEANFLDVQDNLKKIKNSNPTLATLQINEQRYLADIVIKLKDSLESFENQKNNIEVVEIAKLEEESNALKVLMEPYNYKNTDIVGAIMTNDYPTKPKKRLIVVVAFVTGLILSIFFVFFLEFIRNEDEPLVQ